MRYDVPEVTYDADKEDHGLVLRYKDGEEITFIGWCPFWWGNGSVTICTAPDNTYNFRRRDVASLIRFAQPKRSSEISVEEAQKQRRILEEYHFV